MRATIRTAFFVICLGFAALAHPSVGHAQLNNEAQAQVRFGRGREMFVARNFEGALAEFRAAVTLVGSPNTRLYIARCLRELGRNAEAFIEYQRAGAEAADRVSTEPRYAATRDAAHSEGAEVQARTGRLTVHVPNAPSGTSVRVNGTEMPAGAWETAMPMDPRAIEIVAHAPGHLAFRGSVTVTVGHDSEIRVDLPVDPHAAEASAAQARGNGSGHAAPVVMVTERTGGAVRTGGIAVALIGLVGGGVAYGVLYGLAVGRYNQLRSMCGAGGCTDPSYEPRIAEGASWQTGSWIAGGIGAGLVLVGVLMMAAGGPKEVTHPAGEHATRRAPAVRWTPWLAADPSHPGATAGLVGTF